MADSKKKKIAVAISTALTAVALCFGIALSSVMCSGSVAASEPEYVNPTVAPMMKDGSHDRIVFMGLYGSGGVEFRENCETSDGKFVKMENPAADASFKLIHDSILRGANVSCLDDIVLRSGDDVTIKPGIKPVFYKVEYYDLPDSVLYNSYPPILMLAVFDEPGLIKLAPEPAPSQDAALDGKPIDNEPDQGQPAEPADSAPSSDVVAEEPAEPAPSGPRFVWEGYDCHDVGPDDVLTRWYAELGFKWYLAHSYTWYGQMIASLNIGDQIMVDGNLVTIQGVIRAYPGDSSADIYDAIGGKEKTVFQTCIEDGSGQVWIFYGE